MSARLAPAPLPQKRWPAFTPEALEQGCRAVAGIPMLASGQRVGALNFYAGHRRAWPADELEIAQVRADMATAATSMPAP